MIIKCAWCNKQLGTKMPLEDETVSHTICTRCKAIYENKNHLEKEMELVRQKIEIIKITLEDIHADDRQNILKCLRLLSEIEDIIESLLPNSTVDRLAA